jgi:hypothetical protein
MTIPVKVELEAKTDKATAQMDRAFRKMKDGAGAVSKAAKDIKGHYEEGAKAIDKSTSSAIKFMASMAKVNAVLAIAKKAADWGEEFIKSGEATQDQIVAWQRIGEMVQGAKVSLGEYVVVLAEATSLWTDLFTGTDDIEARNDEMRRDNAAKDIAAQYANMKLRADWMAGEGGELRRQEQKMAVSAALEHAAYESYMRDEAIALEKKKKAQAEYVAWLEKEKQRKAELAEQLLAESRDNRLYFGSPIRPKTADELGPGDEGYYDDRGDVSERHAEAEIASAQARVESVRAATSAAVEFMMLDRRAKVEHAKLMAKQEGFEALTDLAAAATAFAFPGGQITAGAYLKSAAMHAAAAAAWGAGSVALGAMGGGGNGGAGAPSATNYARPSSSSAGGNVTNIYNINGYVGQPHELAEELDKRANSAKRAGVIGGSRRVAFS